MTRKQDATQRTQERRRFLAAWTILWGNRHFDIKTALVPSADGNNYTVRNIQYAAALLDALADKLEIGLEVSAARQRATSIVERVLHDEAFLRRHIGRGARPLTQFSGANEMLAVLIYLQDHFDRLSLDRKLERSLKAAAHRLFQIQADRAQKIVSRLPGGSPQAAPMTVEEWIAATGRTLGRAYHWTDAMPFEVDELVPDQFPWPFPHPVCTLSMCRQTQCFVDGYIPTTFFLGDRKSHEPGILPVILVWGWQVQFSVQTGGGGFGDEDSFSTHEPSWAPSGNGTDMPIAPPFIEMLPGIPSYRGFHGLGTMLRCGGAYDYVVWGQSHPGGPIQDSVNELRKVIDKTKELYHVSEVILVCHSRGGLIARKCILDQWQQQQQVDVAKLITYGTPHLGAVLATVGEDILAEVIPGVLIAALFQNPGLALLPAEILDTVGLLFGQSAEEHLQHELLHLVTPLMTTIWPNFAGFVASGEEMKPDSAFIQSLNQGYLAANVNQGTKKGNLWQAIDTLLIAGIAPDFVTVFLGSWLGDLSLTGLASAQFPEICSKTCTIGPISFTLYYPCYRWRWHWHPLVRLISDVIPLVPELAPLDTFKEGEGDAVVERSSALAEGVSGPRRLEFKLNHFNIKANNDQQSMWEGQILVYPWQAMFAELGLPLGNILTACAPEDTGCEDFVMSESFG
jgi:hypothetical protein